MASCSKDQKSKYFGGAVFLSHSGKQKHIVRQLYKDLTTKGVSCFFDESRENLPLGKEWAPLIFEAAKTCRVAVLILSKDFIQSKWPMLELSAFVDAINSGENSNLEILPFFYKISLDYLKELTSSTQDIPEWTRLGISKETQTKWKEALRKVRRFNGVRFKEGENEKNFRDEIIKGILKLLPAPPFSMPVDSVGLAKTRREVIELLQWTSSGTPRLRLAVVIYGFGGIGKTTLAEAVVAEIKPYHCARVNFDIESSKKDIRKMQEKIVKDLFPKRTKPKFRDCWEGRTEMTKAFQEGGNKSIFLFIDNVPRKQDLKELLPRDMKDLPNGSRILVTTRVLGATDMFTEDEAGVKRKDYAVKHLSDKEAKKFLLQGVAVRQREKIQEQHVEWILNICKGVPLVLKIVRGHFRKQGHSADRCSQILEALEKGKNVNEEELSRTLTDFVYDNLEESSKQAFLDICCFFNGMDPFRVEYIVGAQELTSLEEATFVQRSDDRKTLIVHDIIRQRGRNKAESTRIMNVQSFNDAVKVERPKDIRGLWLNDDCGCVVKEQHLKAMTELRVLALGKHTRVSHRCEVTFKELRYLTVGGDIPCLPVNLERLPKLAIYEGPFFKEGFSMHKLPKELRVIIAARQSDYKSTSSKESLLTSLQILKWEKGDREKWHKMFWGKKGSIEELPKEVCQLTKLTQLTLSGWRSLTCLPESFGELKGLTHLDLSKCNALERLPESFEQLAALEKLSLSRCKALQCLPKSFGKLKALNELNLTLCRALKRLPESFGKLKSLKSLDLIYCYTLESLPKSFGQLAALKTLTLRHCTALQCLSESFGELKALRGLDLEFCVALKRLPESFRKLTSLLYIRMAYCPARADLSKFETNVTIVDEDKARADLHQRDACLKQLFIEDTVIRNPKDMCQVVLRLGIESEHGKRRAYKVIAGVEGVEYVYLNMKEKTVTAIGDVDPVFLVNEFRRKFRSGCGVLSVGPA